MKLITEVNEEINVLVEGSGSKKKDYFIEGIFLQSDVKNRNRRLYPFETLQKEVARYNKEYINKNRAYGELGHPDGPTINLERVSHMIKELKEDGRNFIGKAKIMDTPYGNIVKNLLREGAKLGVSSRGMGTLESKNGTNYVKSDFYLATAADIVADPSAPSAFVQGVMENKEWIYESGTFLSVDVENYKKEIEDANRKEREKVKLEGFYNLLSKLVK